MLRALICSSLLALSLGVAARAEGPTAPVFCGSMTCFQFKVAAQGKDADTRANAAMDVINKYLGGKAGKVSTRSAGKNVQLLLNNELVAVLTPADAAAEKQRSVLSLASKWRQTLTLAFNASKAQK